MRTPLIALLALFATAAPSHAAIVFSQTLTPQFGQARFDGTFSTLIGAYPSQRIPARRFRVEVDTGTLAELSWDHFVEPQKLWWERYDPADDLLLNGNEYGGGDGCVATPGQTTCPATLNIVGNSGRISQFAQGPGYDNCAAIYPILIAQQFIGLETCAETIIAEAIFFSIAVDSGRDVTLTVSTIPEPASWALLIAGFGLVGTTLRRRRRAPA